MGKAVKFKSVKELERLIEGYFEECERTNEPLTITGLALFLDTTRKTLMEYQRKDKFADTIKRAKLRVENAYEKRLINRGNSGDIFALKQFGWRDKFDQELMSPKEAPFMVKVII